MSGRAARSSKLGVIETDVGSVVSIVEQHATHAKHAKGNGAGAIRGSLDSWPSTGLHCDAKLCFSFQDSGVSRANKIGEGEKAGGNGNTDGGGGGGTFGGAGSSAGWIGVFRSRPGLSRRLMPLMFNVPWRSRGSRTGKGRHGMPSWSSCREPRNLQGCSVAKGQEVVLTVVLVLNVSSMPMPCEP